MIPVTILTGFLGAGKTTLLNRVLTENHGHKLAIIENEFGETSIDNEILLQNANEQIIELNNGCICCTIRGDLAKGLSDLIERKLGGTLDFDHVVIETTGLANPGPVAQTFFVDDEVATHYRLDSIITIVDAKHAQTQLTEHEVAQRQVGFADRIFLSKTDLVTPVELEALILRLKHMNPRAPITRADFGAAPIAEILDLHGFNLNAQLDIDPSFLTLDAHEHAHDHVHDEHCGHDHHHPAQHADDISAFVFQSTRAFNSAKLDEFLSALVNVYGPRMLRYKGVLYMQGVPRKVVFQGVHQLMGSDLAQDWGKETPHNKMVFIGKNLPQDIFVKGLEQCLM